MVRTVSVGDKTVSAFGRSPNFQLTRISRTGLSIRICYSTSKRVFSLTSNETPSRVTLLNFFFLLPSIDAMFAFFRALARVGIQLCTALCKILQAKLREFLQIFPKMADCQVKAGLSSLAALRRENSNKEESFYTTL